MRRRRTRRTKAEYHRAYLEVLEPRLALSATLSPLADVNLLAGAPLNLAVHANDDNGEILYYDVSSSNPDVTPNLLDPYYNRSVRFSVNYTGNPNTSSDDFNGEMVFQLFEEWAPNATSRFTDLIDSGGEDGTPFYDGLTFHRIIQDFMIQGGDPKGDGTGGSGVKFDDEFTSELQFTSSGILAMANSGSDTNDSQFFITSAPYRFGDFRYTIFGFLTGGDDVRQKIAAVPVDSNDKPLYPVQISYASVEIDDLNRVLNLSAPAGTTGSSTITVKAMKTTNDGHEEVVASQSFNVTIQADTNNDRPYLDAAEPILDADDNPVDSIDVVAGAQVTFKINALDEESDAIYYGVTIDPSATGITATVDSNTGVGTLTATSGAVGIKAVAIGVRKPTADSNDSTVWDTQLVPVYVRPAAPSVSLTSDSDTGPSNSDGVTNLNNTAGKKLRFNVAGTVSGATVEVMADDVVIGTGTATGASIVIESTGEYTLSDGPHSITVRQTLYDQEVDVGNLQGTTDLASDDSETVNITVDTTGGIAITSVAPTTATEGSLYSYQVTTNETGAVHYTLTTAPTGMTVNASTGLITWTPDGVGGSSVPVTVQASDLGGNSVAQSFSILVASVNVTPTATPQTVRVLSDASKQITLAGDDGDSEVAQTLTFALATQPAHGTISNFNPATGTLTYTPNAGYLGADSFTFTVTDDTAAGEPVNLTSAPGEVSIRVVVPNSQPTATSQAVSTAEGAAKSITLTGDDGNLDVVQALTYAIAQQPLHGTLSGFDPQTGAVTYTPAANYNGPDSFTFTVTDDDQGDPPNLVSSAATVAIEVTPVNAAPVATPASVAVNKDTPRLINLAGDDGDPEVVQALTYAIVSGPSHGTLSGFDPTTGQVTYTPAQDYSGPDSFTFTVTDDAAAGSPSGLTSAPATISLQVSMVNHQPTANAQTVATGEDAALAITLTGDDGDPGVQQALTYAIVSGPSHGVLSGFDPQTGAVRYTPDADFNGTDSFTFTVTDDAAAGDPAALTSSAVRVSISVNSVDDAPRFSATPLQTVLQTGTVHATVHAYDVDVPANTIRYSLESDAPEGVTIDSATGELAWNVPIGFPTGHVSISVRATEINGQGVAGLNSVQAVDVYVQSIGAVLVGVLPPGPAGSGGQSAILPPAQAALSFLPLSGVSGAVPGGMSLTLGQTAYLQADTVVPPGLAENVMGPENPFGGGTVVTPESEQGGEQGKAGEKPAANAEPQNPTPGGAKKSQDAAPAAKQTSQSAARSNDVALALLATESAYYAEAGEEEAAEAVAAEEPAEAAD